jgi:uncharacterized membrane protein YfcA
MHVDPYVAVAGFIVGMIVGMTGVGGGALMTPILILIFRVHPLAAVSSDLVASMVMKPVGAAVHIRRGTVRKDLVGWLMVGSIPAAFAGVLVDRLLGNGAAVTQRLKLALGVALLIAAAAIVVKGYIQNRQLQGGAAMQPARPAVRRLSTVLLGAVGGLMVGMTSVGSGSLIVVGMMLLYPALPGSALVGTNLVQAIPLVTAAAAGHLLFGDFQFAVTVSILLGSIPGVYLGARLSSRAPDVVIRPAIMLVLLISALKLLDVGSIEVVAVVLGLGSVAAIALLQKSQNGVKEELRAGVHGDVLLAGHDRNL